MLSKLTMLLITVCFAIQLTGQTVCSGLAVGFAGLSTLNKNDSMVTINAKTLHQISAIYLSRKDIKIVSFEFGGCNSGNFQIITNYGPQLSSEGIEYLGKLHGNHRISFDNFVFANVNGFEFRCPNVHFGVIIK